MYYSTVIKSMLIAGMGGFVGTCLRYLVGAFAKEWINAAFPWATFIVNIIGCLIIGIIYGLSEKSSVLTASQVVLFATGFCGGFTTFSAFANEALVAGVGGDAMLSAIYVGASVAAGVFCVWAGRALVDLFI